MTPNTVRILQAQCTDTAGKEQDDTASSDDSMERRDLEKAADMLLGRSAYCEKYSWDRYSDKR